MDSSGATLSSPPFFPTSRPGMYIHTYLSRCHIKLAMGSTFSAAGGSFLALPSAWVENGHPVGRELLGFCGKRRPAGWYTITHGHYQSNIVPGSWVVEVEYICAVTRYVLFPPLAAAAVWHKPFLPCSLSLSLSLSSFLRQHGSLTPHFNYYCCWRIMILFSPFLTGCGA